MKVLLERQGAISQTTGEDWTNVKLRLSTGQPRLSPQGADPRSWKLSLHSPSVGAVSELSYNRAAAAPAALRSAKVDELKQEAPLEVQTTFSPEFEVPGPVSLPSDAPNLTFPPPTLPLPPKIPLPRHH